jgi:hypothetical protein
MADVYVVRAYEAERENHRREAERALTFAKQHIERALASLTDSGGAVPTNEGRQVTAYSAEAWAHIQALDSLNRVRFLVTEAEGQEG